jgi:ABC-type transporter Mla subunit MlaD
MPYHSYMVENVDLTGIIERLSAEFDALIDERQKVRAQAQQLQQRAAEIDRKINGIQQTLQGFSLYSNAQETPTELTRKVQKSLAEAINEMSQRMSHIAAVTSEVPKTLTECCRDVLRRNGGWVSAVQVRDALLAAGFDFSTYTSNPLTSIHTTLKRFLPDEVEAYTRAEGTLYRWRSNGLISESKSIPNTTVIARASGQRSVQGLEQQRLKSRKQ